MHITKPGKHGTLYLYEIRYRDGGDGHFEATCRCYAYDAEHAQEKFLGGPDADGWEILGVKRVRAS
jgi:hypothetical protein